MSEKKSKDEDAILPDSSKDAETQAHNKQNIIEDNQTTTQTETKEENYEEANQKNDSHALESKSDKSEDDSTDIKKSDIQNSLKELNDDEDDEDDDEDDEDKEAPEGMTLLDHLRELKKRLLRSFMAIGLGFLICYSFAEPLFNVLVQPLLAALPEGGKLIYTGLPEAFFAYLKVAFVAGLFVASPLVFYQIWAFISPGLYDEEKRYIIPIAFFSAFFFIAGGAFAYYVVFPFAFPFFLSYSTDVIEAQPKMDEYLSLVLQMIFAFGLIFELPLFTFFLSKMGLVTAKAMRRYRRYAILVNFIVAAILTPPDPISQLAMAIPMLALYELSIWVAQYFGKKEKVEQEEEKTTVAS